MLKDIEYVKDITYVMIREKVPKGCNMFDGQLIYGGETSYQGRRPYKDSIVKKLFELILFGPRLIILQVRVV